MKALRFVLVGPGALGVSLSAAWIRAGHRCIGVYGRRPARAARARALLGVRALQGNREKLPGRFDFMLLAVPDDAVAGAARRWATRGAWRNRFAFHTSGALAATLLEPIRRKGASVASLHPLTSVPAPRETVSFFEGTAFGIEGDPGACALAERLVRGVGGEPFRIPAGAKPLYHAGACLASGYLLALVALASEPLERMGNLSAAEAREALLGLSIATLHNARELGFERALTGPVMRGDVDTLRRHLTALGRRSPSVKRVYTVLAAKMLEMALKGGRIKRRTARDLMTLFQGRSRGKMRNLEPAGGKRLRMPGVVAVKPPSKCKTR